MPTKPVKESDRQRCNRACGNCARRKEKCSGQVPCARCLQRCVADSCHVSASDTIPTVRSRSRNCSSSHCSSESSNQDTSNSSSSSSSSIGGDAEPPRPQRARTMANHPGPSDASRAVSDSPTLWGDAGELIYHGDTADATLLEEIRHLAQDVVGDCDFVNNSFHYKVADPIPQESTEWTSYMTHKGPPKPSPEEAKKLIETFLWVTTFTLDMFDETDLVQPLAHWVIVPTSCEQHRDQDIIYFLIFAIAAQADPPDKESLADKYFAYGRYLQAYHYSEELSMTAVQSYMLIAMYLLTACRRDAAFMYTGIATRAAYALGLHRDDTNFSFPTNQQMVRKRLWKAVRILDGYISANLGRVPASSQMCGAIRNYPYSASFAMTDIFEEITQEVYSKRHVSSDVLRNISHHQREWTTRFREGVEHDGVPLTDFIGSGDHRKLNLGLLFIKSAYYESIILLTRPSLVDLASSVASAAETSSVVTSSPPAASNVMISACVDSAIKLIELFQGLPSLERLPKRLPYVVGAVHMSTLILGLSVFLDFDRLLPIKKHLELARSILVLFSTHDPLAKFNLAINESLQRCCKSYIDKREQKIIKRQGQLVTACFGSLNDPETLGVDTTSNGDYSISNIFSSDHILLEPENSTYSLLDVEQCSVDVREPGISTPTIATELYDFNFPTDHTLFESHDSGISKFSTLNASFVDIV